MSKRYAVFLHRNVTDEYSPLFECIYTTEVAILVFFLLISPFPIWIAIKAQPVHRNLRYAFALAAVQGIFGTIARLALLFSQYFINDFAGNIPSILAALISVYNQEYDAVLTAFTMIRRIFLAYFVFAMINITLERLVATLFWSWYERQGRSTILVLIITLAILEFFAVWSAYIQTYAVHSKKLIISIMGSVVVIGATGFVLLLRYNLRELRRIKRGVKFDKYSLNRAYQLRENVAMMRMLTRIAGPTVVLNAPAFAFYAVHLLIPKNIGYDLVRYLAIAMYDYWITVYSVIMALAFPFFEKRFRRIVHRAPIIGSLFPRNVRITPSDRFDDFTAKYATEDHDKTTDHYFNWLKRDLSRASKYRK